MSTKASGYGAYFISTPFTALIAEMVWIFRIFMLVWPLFSRIENHPPPLIFLVGKYIDCYIGGLNF